MAPPVMVFLFSFPEYLKNGSPFSTYQFDFLSTGNFSQLNKSESSMSCIRSLHVRHLMVYKEKELVLKRIFF